MKILLLLGNSGCGKSTIARYLEKNYDNYHIIKSYTTRAQRDSFDDDHIFIERDKLLRKIFKEEVVACTVIDNELYCSFAHQFFVAGDNRTKLLRQLVTATGDGAVAATEAIKYINR